MSSAPIVVGTDGSATAQRALHRAAELARALDAPVHVVMSHEPVNTTVLVAAATAYGPIVAGDEGDLDHARRIVDRASEELRELGLRTESHVCTGDPADSLISVANDTGAQMIVVGNRGMAGARRLLGSVPNRVSHHAHCAVLIVPTA